MAPFNESSALRGLDSDNVESLRRLMNAFMHRLAGAPAHAVAEMDELTNREHATLLFLTDHARNNQLLNRMITRFAAARYGNSNTVREAARELDLVVTEAVFHPRTRPEREWILAERFFNQLVANGPAAYGVGAEEEYGDIASDSDAWDDNKDKNDKKDKQVRWPSPYLLLTIPSRPP
jgi:hypothetical protein